MSSLDASLVLDEIACQQRHASDVAISVEVVQITFFATHVGVGNDVDFARFLVSSGHIAVVVEEIGEVVIALDGALRIFRRARGAPRNRS